MPKETVLVVTGDSGFLNKNPLKTKAYYQAQNVIAKKQRYRMQEMEDGEWVDGKYIDGEADKYIQKNKGIDPNYVRPSEMVEQLSQKDIEIARLHAEQDRLKAQIENLQSQPVKKNKE